MIDSTANITQKKRTPILRSEIRCRFPVCGSFEDAANTYMYPTVQLVEVIGSANETCHETNMKTTVLLSCPCVTAKK
jgi:hypothetical protein